MVPSVEPTTAEEAVRDPVSIDMEPVAPAAAARIVDDLSVE